MPSVTKLAARAYALSLFLCPPAFRREFGDELLCDFEDATEESWASRGWRGAAAEWLFVAFDMARAMPALWWRSGVPGIALASTTISVAMLLGVTELRPRAIAFSPIPAERDGQILLLLISVVILVIANTLIITLWFLQPILTRGRKLTPCFKRAD